MHEPTFYDAVLGEPFEALAELSDSWIGREYLDDKIRRTDNAVSQNVAAFVRDEEQIRLHDERAVCVEYDIERCEPDLTQASTAGVLGERKPKVEDYGLMARQGGLGHSELPIYQLRWNE